MTMTVFDFVNREVKIELPDKPIKAISDWLAFRPSDGRTAAYLRQERFS